MAKLPQLKANKIIKVLVNLGFEKSRVHGSHLRLIHPDGRKVTVAIHNEPIPKGTFKAILRQARIGVEEFLK